MDDEQTVEDQCWVITMRAPVSTTMVHEITVRIPRTVLEAAYNPDIPVLEETLATFRQLWQQTEANTPRNTPTPAARRRSPAGTGRDPA